MSICPVNDFLSARAILSSPDFVPFSMAEAYTGIARMTGLDLSASIRIMECLPPFLHGPAHRDVQRRMAARISATLPTQQAAVREGCARLVAELVIPGAEFDLVSDLAQPLWRSLSAVLIGDIAGASDGIDLADDIPVLFSSVISLARRKSINARIESFLSLDPANVDDRRARVALAVLGARPFVGALSLSLFHAIDRHGPCRASRIPWSSTFADTPLTYVDRVALKDAAVGPNAVQQGERLRVMTVRPDYTPDQERKLLFGLGTHACLGRSIAEFSWKHVVDAIAKTNVTLHAVSLDLAKDSEPFAMPARAMLSVR